MFNRRALILSVGKATVVVPIIAASHTLARTPIVDGTSGPDHVPSRPTPDELLCQALSIGRAALARHFTEGEQ
jgi:hypothetical protein